HGTAPSNSLCTGRHCPTARWFVKKKAAAGAAAAGTNSNNIPPGYHANKSAATQPAKASAGISIVTAKEALAPAIANQYPCGPRGQRCDSQASLDCLASQIRTTACRANNTAKVAKV